MRPTALSMRLSLVFVLAPLAACDPFEEEVPDESDAVIDEDVPAGADATGCDVSYVRSEPGGATTTDGLVGHTEQLGNGPTPRGVHIGWPDVDTSTSISFSWLTDELTSSSSAEDRTLAAMVQYAAGEITNASELTETHRGVSYGFGGPGNELFQGHEIKICGGLTPDTVYSYRVGGEGAWSPIYTFRTPPTPGTFDTYTVAFSGDSRGAYAKWEVMLQQMEAFDPDFYVFSGDMVELGANQSEWEAWFEASADVLARKVIVPAHGNHELLAVNYFAQFSLPGNEQWFQVDYGNMTLLSLNDTVDDSSKQDNDQASFITQTLGASSADWKVAVHHQPMFSTCTTHNSDLDVRDAWARPLLDNGADFIFAGHNHIYERSQSVFVNSDDQFDATTTLGDGALYIVSGGAGAPLYKDSENSLFFADVADPVEHFLIGEFGPTAVTMKAYDLDGNVIDEFTVPMN